MLQIKNLTFSYKNKDIFKDISLDITPEKLTIILGPNGAGKSTLFRLIAGILQPHSGRIFIKDKDIFDFSLRERSKTIGYLQQQHKAVFPFTVKDVVLTGRAGHARFTPGTADDEFADQAIQQAGISHLKERFYTELSGGEQQLVMLARLFAQDPKIILLDEPTSHLDFENQAHVFNVLRTVVNTGKTVIVIVQDPNVAALYGDNFVFIKDQKLFTVSNDKQIWNKAFLQNFYSKEIEVIPYKNRVAVFPAIEN